MKPRIFQAPHMLAALEAVQRELGPDALVLSARQIPSGPAWQVWRRTGVEVMAIATMDQAVSATADTVQAQMPHPPLSPSPNPAPAPAAPAVSTTTESGKNPPAPASKPGYPITTLPVPLARPANPVKTRKVESVPVPPPLTSSLAEAKAYLLAQGVDETLAMRWIAACAQGLRPSVTRDENILQKALCYQIEAGINSLPEDRAMSDRIICMIGASGVGKSSVTAHLAARFTRAGRKTDWICADTVRAGAIAATQACADSLSLPVHLAYTPAELAGLARRSQADHILVDMPQSNPRKQTDVLALGDLLAALPRRAVYLVISATTKDSELQQTLAALGAFDLRALVITRLDECETIGSVLNLAWRSRLPLAFFTLGPRLIDDIQPASIPYLTEMLFNTR